MRLALLAFAALALTTATAPANASDPAWDPPTRERAPRWPWIGPSLQVAAITGASAISLANGLAPGRVALDTAGASLGAGIGTLGMVLFAKHAGLGNDPLKAIFWTIPVAIGAAALGGLALGEVIWSNESPIPSRTVWPAMGGFAIGGVVDIAAIATASSSSPPNDGATIVSLILAPLTAGACTVAGYSIAR